MLENLVRVVEVVEKLVPHALLSVIENLDLDYLVHFFAFSRLYGQQQAVGTLQDRKSRLRKRLSWSPAGRHVRKLSNRRPPLLPLMLLYNQSKVNLCLPPVAVACTKLTHCGTNQ